jgi:hypothetical protein
MKCGHKYQQLQFQIQVKATEAYSYIRPCIGVEFGTAVSGEIPADGASPVKKN